MATVAVWIAFLVSFLLTPSVCRLAWRIGAIDCPRDYRRMHKKSIPRCGGIALLTAICLGGVLSGGLTPVFAAGLGGGVFIFSIGLADDIRSLPAGVKLSVQLFAASVAIVLYGRIEGWDLLWAILWILSLTNAHNFIDGLDGLFGGTAVIEGVCLALLLFFTQTEGGALPLVISASCLGFLCYNRPPAKIFAGDCGSATVGFVFAVCALPLLQSPRWELGGLAPLFVFAYPLTDLTAAVLRRLLRRKNPFSADRAHLHHRVTATGLSSRGTTCALLLLSASLGSIGVALGIEAGIYAALVSIAVTLLALCLIRRFVIHFAKSG